MPDPLKWKIYGAACHTSDIDGSDKSGAMKFRTNADAIVRGIRTWFFFYNSPVFAELRMRVYEDRDGVAGKLIATSLNHYTPSDVMTMNHALKGVGFTMPDMNLKGTSWYHCLPYAVGYTGNASTHIGWIKAFPKPEYRTGLSLTYESMHVRPYRFMLVGSYL